MSPSEWWSAELLDKRDFVKRDLPRVRGGNLEWSVFRSVGGAGSLEITLPEGGMTAAEALERMDAQATTRRNLVPNPQGPVNGTLPFRVNSNWFGLGGSGTNTHVAGEDMPARATQFMRKTWTRIGTAAQGVGYAVTGPVTAGETFTLSFYWRHSTVGMRFNRDGIAVTLKTASGATVAVHRDYSITTQTLPPDAWLRRTSTFTVPQDAVSIEAHLEIYCVDLPAIGDTLDCTAVLLEQGASLGGFFDGSTPQQITHEYVYMPGQWDGAPNASTSRQVVIPRAAWDVYQRALADDLKIDWLSDRVRLTHHKGDKATPFGVWLLSAPSRQTDGPLTHTTLELSDKTELLNSELGQWYTAPAGTNVAGRIASIIRARGEPSPQVTDNPAALQVALSWEPSDTWLKVVNDLAKAINYGSLWADGRGQLRCEPYVPPAERTPAATYGAGASDLRMLPAYADEADLWAIPTGFVIYTQGDETTPGLVGRADLPDAHPLSARNRGRELLRTEQAEAASQQIANAIAKRRLDEALQMVRRATITHPIDGTQMTDVVTHGPLKLKGAIVNREISLEVGAIVTDSVRHIYTTGEASPWL